MRVRAEEGKPGKPVGKHTLSLEGRARAVVSGVEDVDSFNEQLVTLSTVEGTLTIAGEGLHIAKLVLEEGQLLVEGRVTALEYDERKKPRGAFRRLLQ